MDKLNPRVHAIHVGFKKLPKKENITFVQEMCFPVDVQKHTHKTMLTTSPCHSLLYITFHYIIPLLSSPCYILTVI